MPPIDSEKLTAWYNFQAPFYSLWRDAGRHVTFETVLTALGSASSADILDAGCGSGLFAVPLAVERRCWRIVGLDASAGMIEIARRRQSTLGLVNLDLQVGDLMRLPFADESFDAVVLAGVCPNLSDLPGSLQELYRTIKPGGRMVVVEFDRPRMSLLTRWFFHLMIGGYRIISTILRQFRFAENWSLEATTILSEDLLNHLKTAGFEGLSQQQVEGYYVLTVEKPRSSQIPA